MVDVGLTLLLHVVPPFPVFTEPSLNVKVHAPFAVMLPLILVGLALHIDAAELVILAVGLAITVVVSEPVNAEPGHEEASLKDVIV